MYKAHDKQTQNRPFMRLWLWAVAVLACVGGAVAIVYFWRVFYAYGQYPFAHIPPAALTAVLAGVGLAGCVIAFLCARFVKSFSAKAAAAVFCVGLLFVFINPPLQVPDEAQHYLRAHSIASGHLDFDAQRSYPPDVQALMKVFRLAWTSAHDGDAIKARTEGKLDNPTPQDAVRGEGIANLYVDYAKLMQGDAARLATYGDPAEGTTREPVLFVILPLLPQAFGIFIARLLGFDALGALYGARLANLACYALLCWAAIKRCRRYRPVFLTVALLPLTLFMASSCSYDGMMLGLYLFAGSYFCMDEVRGRDLVWFALAVALMGSVKINNLLWLALPLVLPKTAWKARIKKWQAAAGVLGLFALLYGAITLYNGVAIHNYGEIGRTIEGADQAAQMAFMLQNPLGTIARFLGTLFENNFFLSQLGTFGNVDLHLPLIGTLSPFVLLLGAALSVHQKSSLTPRSCFGLLGLAVLYAGSNLAGLYVTYTPVSMVRVIGLQARYFIPVYLMLFILAAALLSHVLAPGDAGRGTARAVHLGFYVAVAFGLCGALLLLQTYFIGPVVVKPLA